MATWLLYLAFFILASILFFGICKVANLIVNVFPVRSKYAEPVSDDDRGKLLSILILVPTLIVSVLISAFIVNFGLWRGYTISQSLEQWGQMGDFFGGMLNPILAFASFIALLYTIMIQSETQHEVTTNAKADRTLSMLIPEYHRHEKGMTQLLDQVEALFIREFALNGGSDVSIGKLIGVALVRRNTRVAKSESKLSIADVGERIGEQINNSGVNYISYLDDYLSSVLLVKRASKDIIQVVRRIESLSDVQLFRDKYQLIAKHLLIAEILSQSPVVYNYHGMNASYLGDMDPEIAEEVNRMATESYGLVVDTF